MELDLLIDAGTVLTMDPSTPRATQIGVWNGRIVGVDQDVAHLSARRHIDLRSCTVVPGLRDAHCHTTSVGVVGQHLDLSDADTTAGAMDALARYSLRRDPQEPIVGFGWAYGAGPAAPRHDQLAAASGDRTVLLIHRSGHEGVASTRLLHSVNDLVQYVDPRFVDRDGSGAMTGVLREAAMDRAKETLGVGSTDDLVTAIDVATAQYVSLGLTGYTEAGIGCPGLDHSPVELAVYQRARDERRLHVRATLMVYSEQLHPLHPHERDPETFGLDLGMRSFFGDSWLRLGAMKLWADGTGSSGDHDDDLVDDPAVLTDRIVAAHRAGWQVAVHAMGNRAVDVLLDALDTAGPRGEVRARRHRIEHAASVRPDQVSRMASLGMVAVIQPAFLHAFGDLLGSGSPNADDTIRARSFLESGVAVAASSDAPVADPSPLAGLASLVTRRTASGATLGAAERLSTGAALHCYTRGAAYADHLEQSLGSITARKRADLTVLSRDPSTMAAADLDDLEVVATVIGGTVAFSSDPALLAPDVTRD